MSLHVVPLSFADACAFVADWHRHHQPPVGHKFSLGVAADTTLVGAAIAGRPVARHFDNGTTLEVTRSATDGTPHVNSMLYAACWRAAKALGYTRLITYTQHGEPGTSLRAAGWQIVAQRPARPGWDTPSRPRTNRNQVVAANARLVEEQRAHAAHPGHRGATEGAGHWAGRRDHTLPRRAIHGLAADGGAR